MIKRYFDTALCIKKERGAFETPPSVHAKRIITNVPIGSCNY